MEWSKELFRKNVQDLGESRDENIEKRGEYNEKGEFGEQLGTFWQF